MAQLDNTLIVINKDNIQNLPSEDYAQSANSLFHFMSQRDFLKEALTKKALVPRYSSEHVRFLDLSDGSKSYDELGVLAKCFCDIPLNKLTKTIHFSSNSSDGPTESSSTGSHLDIYGPYGIAFSKSWGEENGLQPVIYLNNKSQHYKLIKDGVLKALKRIGEDSNANDDHDDYFLSLLMLLKPLRGPMNRCLTDLEQEFFKNFHDEQEWRYIPSFDSIHAYNLVPSVANSAQVTIRPLIAQKKILRHTDGTSRLLSLSAQQHKQEASMLWLKFDYNDIRYLTVPNREERRALIDFIHKLDLEKMEESLLISKILVLDELGKDW